MSADLLNIYHTKTKEEYDYLMGRFELDGYIWSRSKRSKPTDLDRWSLYEKETCIFEYDDKTIAVGKLDGVARGLNIKQITTDTDNVEKPSHYQGIFGLMVETVLRNFIPRYKNTYIAHRIASAIEYLLRAPLKNGIEDIKKAYHCIGLALEELGEDETI